MTRLLGVHGIGNFQPGYSSAEAADRLAIAWLTALRAGLVDRADDVDLRIAYYAPTLNTAQAQGADTPEALDDDAARALLAWTVALGAPVEVSQGRLTQPARQAATWIARRFGLDSRLVAAFVGTFCREVSTYLRDADSMVRAAAREAVATAIAEQRPAAVLAHSLGSVVTYEALWEHPELQVDLLITLGSPLAMPDVVFDRLAPPPIAGRGARPPGIGRWVNIADIGDLVAVPRWLGHAFDVDEDVEAHLGVFDFHRARNYLRCSQTCAALTPILS